ncbi:MAG: alkaline phosphatase family protein [Peptococcaceae bacterium]|nr:alkaline phosphatase family protein [Peptococcaceae bacterium]
MDRKAHTEKVLVLGVDGLDPKFSRRLINEGKMKNLAQIVERGACREDLVLLGGHPTITPPMWTTLATGCYANVHGITGFYRQHPDDLAGVTYALDSRDCKAEAVWNCTAESGKKTLVFHWPGSSWPPTSDSENLYVVDGTSPGALGMATSQTEKELMLIGTDQVTGTKYVSNADPNVVAICLVEELPERTSARDWSVGDSAGFLDKMSVCDDWGAHPVPALDIAQSFVREPKNWAFEIPSEAKETAFVFSRGLIQRPGLILKNNNGIYDRIALYKSKKETTPLVVLKLGQIESRIIDEGFDKHDEKLEVTRNMKLIEMADDGSNFKVWISAAMRTDMYDTWSPQRMYDYVKAVAGPTPPTSNMYEQMPELHQCMMDSWKINIDWQVKALHKIIEEEGIEVVFSHMHNVDLINHTFISNLSKWAHQKRKIANTHDVYVQWQYDLYEMTDQYLGEFIHFLDEGWTIIVTSDHAQVASTYGKYPHLGSVTGWSLRLMQKLGYTEVKHDAEGNELREIDWSKTRAIANRSADIWINLKGRQPEGIVDPEDKYELEEQIMTDLYQVVSPVTGKRVVSLAVRNKDAVHFGLGGPECGDIVYFLAEGYNQHHGDSLSTFEGDVDTSVSPIFVGAGPGFKQGYYTDHIIRQVDVAPTVSALLGVRMPAQCEGAPIYQILDWEF